MDRSDVSFTFLDRIREIEENIEDGRFQSALALAVTLPDICGGIAFPELVKRGRDGRILRRPYGGPWDRPGLRDRGGRYMYGRCSRKQAYGFRSAGKGRWDQGDGRLPDVPWSCGGAA